MFNILRISALSVLLFVSFFVTSRAYAQLSSDEELRSDAHQHLLSFLAKQVELQEKYGCTIKFDEMQTKKEDTVEVAVASILIVQDKSRKFRRYEFRMEPWRGNLGLVEFGGQLVKDGDKHTVCRSERGGVWQCYLEITPENLDEAQLGFQIVDPFSICVSTGSSFVRNMVGEHSASENFSRRGIVSARLENKSLFSTWRREDHLEKELMIGMQNTTVEFSQDANFLPVRCSLSMGMQDHAGKIAAVPMSVTVTKWKRFEGEWRPHVVRQSGRDLANTHTFERVFEFRWLSQAEIQQATQPESLTLVGGGLFSSESPFIWNDPLAVPAFR